MKTHSSISKKLIALVLMLTMALPLLGACASRAVPSGELALTEIGTVDGQAVLYEELYFLVHNDLSALKDKYGADTEGLKQELGDMVSQQLVQNYARLRLCENMGLAFDEKDLADEAQAYVDALIEESFEGDRNAYLNGLREVGMTDHYLRFTAMVDALYDRLPTVYGEANKIPVTNDEIRNYVKQNFVRTRHIAVLVEAGESYEENYQKAEAALALLQSGESMHSLIGSRYNEDITLTTTDGFYFARGSMEEAYEEAAFALKEQEYSGIVEAVGQSNLTGDGVPCFYIIERLPIEDGYVNRHLTELGDDCADAIIAADLALLIDSMHFTPNEAYQALNLCALAFPEPAIDWPYIFFWIALVLVSVAIVIGAIFLIRHWRRRRRATITAMMKK